ncbi:MAG: aspartate carbamoyltransferase catalytic subunit [Ignavibacteria bacterium]|nr:aspartate carbamoyltransferase catalytic subunit [Ignavibacteria bacterium]
MSMRHLLSSQQLSVENITEILDMASTFLTPTGLQPTAQRALVDKRFVLAFFEPSTRTRLSFETAIDRLGASSVVFSQAGSSVEKGETLQETIHTIEAMGFDGIIIRHADNGVHEQVASYTKMSVINAGEGSTAHPTQALLDASTIREQFGRIRGINVVITGDLLHSRVARSNADVLSRMGANIAYCAPDQLCPHDAQFAQLRRFDNVRDAMQWADVVYLLRIQRERISADIVPSLDEYRKKYAITRELALDQPHVMIMHPGPVNVGVELDEEVLLAKQCLIHRQVTHGVAVRMAILEKIFSDND